MSVQVKEVKEFVNHHNKPAIRKTYQKIGGFIAE